MKHRSAKILNFSNFGWSVLRANILETSSETLTAINGNKTSELLNMAIKRSNKSVYDKIDQKNFKGSDEDLEILKLKLALRAKFNPIPRKLNAGYTLIEHGPHSQIEFSDLSNWQVSHVYQSKLIQQKFRFNPYMFIDRFGVWIISIDTKNRSGKDKLVRMDKSILSILKNIHQKISIFDFDFQKFKLATALSKKQCEMLLRFAIQNEIVLNDFQRVIVKKKRKSFVNLIKSTKKVPEWEEFELHSKLINNSKISEALAQRAVRLAQRVLTIQRFEILKQSELTLRPAVEKYLSSIAGDNFQPLIKLLSSFGHDILSPANLAFHNSRICSTQLSHSANILNKIIFAASVEGQDEVFLDHEILDKMGTQDEKQSRALGWSAGEINSGAVFWRVLNQDNEVIPVLDRIQINSFYAAIGRYAFYDHEISKKSAQAISKIHFPNSDNYIKAIVISDCTANEIDMITKANHLGLHCICIGKVPRNIRRVIELSDIAVRLHEIEGVQFISTKLSKFIKIVSSNLLNQGVSNNPVLDFFNSFSDRQPINTVSPILGILPLVYRPRIRCPEGIISLRTWKFDNIDQDYPTLRKSNQIRELLMKFRVPPVFEVVSDDRRLRIDIDDSKSFSVFEAIIKKSKKIRLTEKLDQHLCNRTFDLVTPFKNNFNFESLSKSSISSLNHKRYVDPKSLYSTVGICSFHINYLPHSEEELFTKTLQSVSREVQKHNSCDFFFVRYMNSSDLKHIRLRVFSYSQSNISKIRNKILDLLEAEVLKNRIRQFSLEPFWEEHERFGGAEGFKKYLAISSSQSKIVLDMYKKRIFPNYDLSLWIARELWIYTVNSLRSNYDWGKKSIPAPSEILEKYKFIEKHFNFFSESKWAEELKNLEPNKRKQFAQTLHHLFCNRIGLSLADERKVFRDIK